LDIGKNNMEENFIEKTDQPQAGATPSEVKSFINQPEVPEQEEKVSKISLFVGIVLVVGVTFLGYILFAQAQAPYETSENFVSKLLENNSSVESFRSHVEFSVEARAYTEEVFRFLKPVAPELAEEMKAFNESVELFGTGSRFAVEVDSVVDHGDIFVSISAKYLPNFGDSIDPDTISSGELIISDDAPVSTSANSDAISSGEIEVKITVLEAGVYIQPSLVSYGINGEEFNFGRDDWIFIPAEDLQLTSGSAGDYSDSVERFSKEFDTFESIAFVSDPVEEKLNGLDRYRYDISIDVEAFVRALAVTSEILADEFEVTIGGVDDSYFEAGKEQREEFNKFLENPEFQNFLGIVSQNLSVTAWFDRKGILSKALVRSKAALPEGYSNSDVAYDSLYEVTNSSYGDHFTIKAPPEDKVISFDAFIQELIFGILLGGGDFGGGEFGADIFDGAQFDSVFFDPSGEFGDDSFGGGSGLDSYGDFSTDNYDAETLEFYNSL
jgi:hypothetical protein